MAALKRNLQEMYSHNGNNGQNPNNLTNTNGTSSYLNIKDEDMQQTNDAKKTRLDIRLQNQEPSRVVHLRNIPQQLSEQEIIYLGLTFGQVTNILFLRSKQQAFIEFENVEDAKQMIAHFNQTLVSFGGKKIFVQYSNHQTLQTDPNQSNNQQAQMALENATQMFIAAKNGGKNCVLRATVLNMMYPVTLDVLNQIFGKFGHVLKLITFNKNDKFQVLLQMKDAIAAQQAKLSLNGQNIYNDCCTLQIDFSKLTTLEVCILDLRTSMLAAPLIISFHNF
jgi:hnRNP-L/PTB/hephaestus splicing factor